jgi:hypothetical protein
MWGTRKKEMSKVGQVFFMFLAVLGFELRALHLLGPQLFEALHSLLVEDSRAGSAAVWLV